MKACNNYQMKKSAIIEMLIDDGRGLDAKNPDVIKAYIHDTALYPVASGWNEGWGIGMHETNGQLYVLDFKDQH